MATSSYKEEPRSLGVANLQASPGDHIHDGVTSRGPVEYTPTWSSTDIQPVLGNGTIYGRYALLGKLVHLYIELTMGSTTTYGTGTYRFSLPIASDGRLWFMPGLSFDTSVTGYEDITGIVTGAGSLLVRLRTLTTVGASLAAVKNDTPITFATGDKLVVNGRYGY